MSLMSFPFLLSSSFLLITIPGSRASRQSGGKNDFLWLPGGFLWAKKKNDEWSGFGQFGLNEGSVFLDCKHADEVHLMGTLSSFI